MKRRHVPFRRRTAIPFAAAAVTLPLLVLASLVLAPVFFSGCALPVLPALESLGNAPAEAPVSRAGTGTPELPVTADKWGLYRYEDLQADIAALAGAWPDLVSPGVLGYSVEGRELPFFLLGKGKREVLICASMHAREYVCTNFVMYMAERYCQGYAAGETLEGLDVRALLDAVRLVVVPMLNPDGVTLAQLGPEYARGTAAADLPLTDAAANGIWSWKANIRGVDLNANWPLQWGRRRGISSVPASANYPGPYPLSEPETQAMWRLLEGGSYCAFCSFHTAGECIYWIDTGNPAELREEFYPAVQRIGAAIGYTLLPAETFYGGCMVNYARDRYGLLGMTVELCPSIDTYPFSDYAGLRQTAEQVLPIGLLLAEEALRQPEPENAVDLFLDGCRMAFPGPRPTLLDGRTAVPLEDLCALCGLALTREGGRPAVTVALGQRRAVLLEGSAVMATDQGALDLPFPMELRSGALYVPGRELLEYFGFQVAWERGSGVWITSPA